MSEQLKDGGPAFPCEWDYINSNREAANGMTLRDFFAAKAMQQIIGDERFVLGCDPDQVADRAYMYADAMLKRRQA
jgi:hypothetical protein